MKAYNAPSKPAPRNHGLLSGSIFAGLAVALGAFGAHAMKAHYASDDLHTFETGVRYQMYHALALIACGALNRTGMHTVTASRLFAGGIVLFSGSLYGLVFTHSKWLGPITPIGGVLFLAGWVSLAIACRQQIVDSSRL